MGKRRLSALIVCILFLDYSRPYASVNNKRFMTPDTGIVTQPFWHIVTVFFVTEWAVYWLHHGLTNGADPLRLPRIDLALSEALISSINSRPLLLALLSIILNSGGMS